VRIPQSDRIPRNGHAYPEQGLGVGVGVGVGVGEELESVVEHPNARVGSRISEAGMGLA
jgi:hypothetical protein